MRDALNKQYRDDHKTEIERAREYYSAQPPPTKAYEFKRYKEWQVCKALDDMFYEKCAYCESRYRAVDSHDVEHYRPKGKVKEAPEEHRGYWWLAAVWSNLLPSCPPCNQRRRQITFTPGMTLEELEEALQNRPQETSGKSNSFPVTGDNWITQETQSISDEDPLLINPCEIDPEQHLEWVFDWDMQFPVWNAEKIMPVLRPKKIDNGQDDPYAAASIAIYGLNRGGLFRERMERLQEIQKCCQTIVDVMEDLAEEGIQPDRKDRLQERLIRYRNGLYSFALPEKQYSAMASAFIALFEAGLNSLRNG